MAKINVINNETQDLTIDPGAAGDSFVQFDINSVGKFRIGVDDDDSDKWKISSGSALGSSDTFIMTAAGERTMPLQPAFLANVTSTKTDVTGDGTSYTITYDTETFDQGGDLNIATGNFTAPVSGKYRFQFICSYGPMTSSQILGALAIKHVGTPSFFVSNVNPFASQNASSVLIRNCIASTAMAASDVAKAEINVGVGTKTVDVFSGTHFSGFLEV